MTSRREECLGDVPLRREIITVSGQSYVSRLPKYWRPTPLSARRGDCVPPAFVGGGRTHSPGGEGGGGSIFWKTRDIGLPSYSNNLFTFPWCRLHNIISSVAGMRKIVSLARDFATRREAFRIEHHTITLCKGLKVWRSVGDPDPHKMSRIPNTGLAATWRLLSWHAQMVFKFLACLVLEKNQYEVFACFFENTY